MISRIKHFIVRIRQGAISEKLENIKWIYKYAKPQAIPIVFYTALGLSGTLVGLLGSFVSKDLVDIITGRQTGKLISVFVVLILSQLAGVGIGQLSSYISRKLSIKVENDLKAEFYDRIMETEWESLLKYHSGDLSVRWSGDSANIASGILNLIPNLIISLFRLISAFIVVVSYDASFAVFAVLSVPLSLAVSKYNMKRMKKSSMSTMAINSKLSGFTYESFTNIQSIKAFDMLPLYSKRLRGLQKEYAAADLRFQRATSVNAIILNLVTQLVTYSTYGWGIYKVWKGDITYGTMTMFLALSGTLSSTIQSLLSFFPSAINVTNSAKRLRGLLELPKEDYSEKEQVKQFYEQNSDKGVGLCVRDVVYTYATGTDVFEKVDFEAHPHEVVALVGPSGEGKTTMMRLLLSLIRAKEGQGYLCAGDTKPEDNRFMNLTASVRQLMAYVPQGNTMFSGTIAENMRNVKEDATDEEIIEALKMACAWQFVERLPKGINSVIKEGGGGFSEGQAQRLSIARALLRRSPILLLDEATSALDVATERAVLKNIMADEYPRTCVVTTHRPSVLTVCNRVYSIHDKKCEVVDGAEIERMIKDF